jgi:hypothetical protein
MTCVSLEFYSLHDLFCLELDDYLQMMSLVKILLVQPVHQPPLSTTTCHLSRMNQSVVYVYVMSTILKLLLISMCFLQLITDLDKMKKHYKHVNRRVELIPCPVLRDFLERDLLDCCSHSFIHISSSTPQGHQV